MFYRFALRSRKVGFLVRRAKAGVGVMLWLLLSAVCRAQGGADPPESPDPPEPPANGAIMPVADTAAATGVDWDGLLKQSASFLVLEQGFRWTTQETTRHTHLPFFKGYVNSVTNLHGWGDGDFFYVNYVGHPMQGAVAGFVWIQNDRKYQSAEIGRNRRYWRSRLRAAAFAWAYSEQFEIGPISEASIGAAQAYFPQQGFVDHVITPTVGLGWIIAEDAVDKYVIAPLEERTSNPYLRLLLRSGLNPSRTLANSLAGKVPWHRYTRAGVFSRNSEQRYVSANSTTREEARDADRKSLPALAPFEFNTVLVVQQNSLGRDPCIGGAGTASVRVSPRWEMSLEVGGCKMNGLPRNYSGDSLHYLIGPRWTPRAAKRWSPYAQLLMGGNTITQEELFPAKKALVEETLPAFSGHSLYTEDYEATGPALKVGAGLDFNLNSAISFRTVGLDYMHTWIGRVNGLSYSTGFQFTSGFILRMGTW